MPLVPVSKDNLGLREQVAGSVLGEAREVRGTVGAGRDVAEGWGCKGDRGTAPELCTTVVGRSSLRSSGEDSREFLTVGWRRLLVRLGFSVFRNGAGRCKPSDY